jgi:hypothetical protein
MGVAVSIVISVFIRVKSNVKCQLADLIFFIFYY